MRFHKSFSPRHAAVVLCLAGICAAGGAGADDLQAIFAHMDQVAAKFKGMSADVTQISHNALLNEDETFNGTTAVRRGPRPHDLRAVVDIKPPNAKKVLLTGHKVEVYYPKNNTVQIIDLDRKDSHMMDQFLLLGFGSAAAEIQGAYDVKLGGSETVAGQKTMRLVLTPKSKDMLAKLTKVELWISNDLGIAVQQKFSEPGDDYILATYTNVKRDPVPQELKWDIPKDAHKEVLNK